MKDFIVKNESWLQHLPIVMILLFVVLGILIIIMIIQIHTRYKNQSLKSRNRKSLFAIEYADCFASNAASSFPLKRKNSSAGNNNSFGNENPHPYADRGQPVKRSGVLEIYFDYEDEYKL